MQKTKTPPSIKELRIFAIILFLGFFIIGHLIPFYKGKEPHWLLVIIAFIILIMGMGVPKLLEKPREYWIIIGNFLGKINSAILFTVIYFLVFTSVGIIFKILKRDRLFRKFREVKSTMVLKTEISPFTDPF